MQMIMTGHTVYCLGQRGGLDIKVMVKVTQTVTWVNLFLSQPNSTSSLLQLEVTMWLVFNFLSVDIYICTILINRIMIIITCYWFVSIPWVPLHSSVHPVHSSAHPQQPSQLLPHHHPLYQMDPQKSQKIKETL